MKKTIYLFLFSMSFGLYANAQYLLNNGADIIITSGSYLTIDGDFTNELDGTIDNSGNISISGDWTNNQTSGNLLLSTSGTVSFLGSSNHDIGGTAATYFNKLDLNNDATVIGPAGISVSSDFTMNNSYLTIGNHSLIMQTGASFIGAGSSGYVITNGTGKVVQFVDASDKIFPIGSSSNYAPVTLNNIGTSDFFWVRAFPDVLTNGLTGITVPEINHCVNMTWDISENVPGGSNLSVTAFWGAGIEGASFDRTHAGMGHYISGDWDPQGEMVAAGSNPYSISRSGLTSLSPFAVGDWDSPMAFPLNLRLNLAAFLEGAFNGSSMDNDLNASGLIPLNQPYNVSPISYPGTESVGAIPNANIIDWVVVELRDATSAANATSGTIVERKALFLRNDGVIVDLDGVSVPNFSSSITNNLYVVIRHRNHLAIMSANAVTPSGGIYSYNFSSAAGQVHGNSSGHKQIAAGVWGMFSANGWPDKFIIIHDRDIIWDPQVGNTGYLSGDFNMDTEVDNVDKNDHWVVNTGETSQVPN